LLQCKLTTTTRPALGQSRQSYFALFLNIVRFAPKATELLRRSE
jgi:hypothetical protein